MIWLFATYFAVGAVLGAFCRWPAVIAMALVLALGSIAIGIGAKWTAGTVVVATLAGVFILEVAYLASHFVRFVLRSDIQRDTKGMHPRRR